jgi:hypothetical protein
MRHLKRPGGTTENRQGQTRPSWINPSGRVPSLGFVYPLPRQVRPGRDAGKGDGTAIPTSQLSIRRPAGALFSPHFIQGRCETDPSWLRIAWNPLLAARLSLAIFLGPSRAGHPSLMLQNSRAKVSCDYPSHGNLSRYVFFILKIILRPKSEPTLWGEAMEQASTHPSILPSNGG